MARLAKRCTCSNRGGARQEFTDTNANADARVTRLKGPTWSPGTCAAAKRRGSSNPAETRSFPDRRPRRGAASLSGAHVPLFAGVGNRGWANQWGMVINIDYASTRS